MNIGKRFIAAVAALCLLPSIYAQGQLPLAVGESVFYDNNTFIYKDKMSCNGSEIYTSDGWGAFTMTFQDAPGMLTLQYSRNQWGKNNEMGLQESSNNTDWTDIYVGNPPTDWTDLSFMLKPETRYIRFWYGADFKIGDWWTKVGYLRDINIAKAIEPCFRDRMQCAASPGV